MRAVWREESVVFISVFLWMCFFIFTHTALTYAVCVAIRTFPSIFAMCSLSNSKMRLFLILKKGLILFEKVNLIYKIFEFVLCIFFIRSDKMLSGHMVMLHCALQMLQCTSLTGHVVPFRFHSFGVNKEKRIHCNYETKSTYLFVLDKCKTIVGKKWYSEPHVDLHKLRKSKRVSVMTHSPQVLLWFKITSFTIITLGSVCFWKTQLRQCALYS